MSLLVGYDVGGTNARISAYDHDLNVLHTARASIREDTSMQAVAACMRSLLDELELSGEVDAIGVGLAAQVKRGGQHVINAPNLGWRDAPFGALLASTLPAPVTLINDLDAILWGEHLQGAAHTHDDVLAVYVGTGIGGALLCGGALTPGCGVSGEIGHVKLVPNGRLCGCGQRGCLEAYAGGIHLEARLRDVAALHPDLATAIMKSGEGSQNVDLLAADKLAAEAGPVFELWDGAARMLALSIANACTLLNPSLLLMGGGVWEHCGVFRELTLTCLPPLILDAARADLSIAQGSLGDRAGMLGAAALAATRADIPLTRGAT